MDIIDITNPSKPERKNQISTGRITDINFSGNFAYVVGDGLVIWDITDRVNPLLMGSLADGVEGALLNNPSSVFVFGDYAYVTSAGSNALEIVDVSDPANPVHKGSISDGVGGAKLNNPSSIFVAGPYAYVASAGSNALEIVDVSDPANPIHKGSIADGVGLALLGNPTGVYVSGIYAYIASAGSNALEIVDISDPANPVHKGSIADRIGGALLSGAYRVFVSGNYAYVASTDALEIVDVSNPVNPVHKANIVKNNNGIFTESPKDIDISGNYVYAIVQDTFKIVDIGNIHATEVNVVSPNQIFCTLDPTGKVADDYNVVVTNPDGQTGTFLSGFTIINSHFIGTPTLGEVPLTVTFTDRSTQNPISWNWSFGDGHFSDLQNPVHIYESSGVFPVSLKITYSDSSDIKTRSKYITVRDPAPIVTGVTPTTGGNTTSIMNMNLTGAHFTNDASVMMTPENPNPVNKSRMRIGSHYVWVRDMYVSGTNAYFVRAGMYNYFEIYDVSDPANPVLKGKMENDNGDGYLQRPNECFRFRCQCVYNNCWKQRTRDRGCLGSGKPGP